MKGVLKETKPEVRSLKPKIMGILNVTPDSFYDGGQFTDPHRALSQAFRMIEEGADIIDVGGESSRPGSAPVTADEELRRVIPILEGIRQRSPIPLSIDTTKVRVALRALEAGAGMINDISAGRFDPEMLAVAASKGVPICLMHMKGTPKTMQENPHYDDVVQEVCNFFEERVRAAHRAGISPDKIYIDPGIGFGKHLKDNMRLLRDLRAFTKFGKEILIGTSRKTFIGKLLGDLPPEERLEGTLATLAIAWRNGANVLRVHDVGATKKFFSVLQALTESST